MIEYNVTYPTIELDLFRGEAGKSYLAMPEVMQELMSYCYLMVQY